MTHRITWKWIAESMFPLTVADCRRAGIDVDRWALGQPENSGRALMLVEGTSRDVLMRFSTPADADRFFQGMRFAASRVTVPDVHPLDTTTTDAGDTAGSAFTLTVDTDNAAFHDEYDADVPAPGPELARILRDVAERVEYAGPGESGQVMDVNGNHVGRWEHTAGAVSATVHETARGKRSCASGRLRCAGWPCGRTMRATTAVAMTYRR